MAAEEQELIDSYVNRAAVSEDTVFLETELEKVLVKFNQLNALKLKLNVDSSWKEVATTQDQVKKSTDGLVSSMLTYRTVQDQVAQAQNNLRTAYTAQNGSILENAKALALLKVAQKEVTDLQKLYAQGLANGEVTLEEYVEKTSELILKQNELKVSTAELNKAIAAKPKTTAVIDDPTNANIPFTVNGAPKDEPEDGGFTETAAEANAAVAGAAASQNKYTESIKQTVLVEEQFVTYTEKVAQTLAARKLELKDNSDAQASLATAYKNGLKTQDEYLVSQGKLTVQASQLKTEIAALNKEINIAAKADFAQPGSSDELNAQTARLRQEKNTLSIIPDSDQTDADKERLIEINALLDRNTELVKENADAYLKQKLNIGNYPENFKIAFAGIEGELTRVNTLLDEQGKGSQDTKLVQQQTALQNAIGLVGQEFTSTTARQNAYKEAGKEIGAVYGTDSEVFKNFATNVAAGAAENKKLGDALSENTTKGNRFTNALSSIFGSLRQIAYAIPGIGLAGLIGLLLDPFIAFGAQLVKTKSDALDANGALRETADVLDKINDVLQGTQGAVVKAFEDVNNLKTAFDQVNKGLLSSDDAVKLYNDTLGKTAGAVDTLDQAEQKVAQHADDFIKYTLLKAAAQVAAGKAAQQAFEAAVTAQKSLNNFQSITDIPVSAGAGSVASGGDDDLAKKEAERQLEIQKNQARRRQEQVDEANKQKDAFLKIFKEFQDQANAIAANAHFFVDPKTTADQLKDQQDELEKQIQALDRYAAKQKQIADNDKNTYEIRRQALVNYNNTLQNVLAKQTQSKLLGTTGNQEAGQVVYQQQQTALVNLQIASYDRIKQLDDSYYQRKVKANYEALQAQLEDTSRINEAIYADESRGLQQRLDAFKNYITAQKTLNDAAYVEKLQAVGFSPAEIQAIEAGDKVQIQGKKITNEELEALTIEHDTKQEALASESGKKIYEIVSSYAKAQEKAIKEGNASNFTSAAQQQYTDQLNSLNDSLAKQLISVATYEAKKDALEKQYAVIHLANQVEEDNANISAFEKGKQDLIDEEFSAEQELQAALASGNKNEINANQEKLDALRDAEAKFNADIGAARKKAADDQVALFNATSKLLIDAKKQESTDIKKLESAGLDLVKTIIDAGYEYRIQAIDAEITAAQTRAAAEVTAEQQTGDSAQEQADKIANINAREADQEKQLNAEKAKEKRKEAEIDRLAQIAQITATAIQTEFSLAAKAAEATATGALLAANPVTAAFSGLAFAAAASIAADEIIVAGLAAAQIGQILASPLPAYRFGTGSTPHPGGWAKLGDGGKSELLEFSDGSLAVTPARDTYMNLPAETHVHPDAMEVFKEMRYSGFRQPPAYMPGTDRQGYERQIAAEYKQSTNRIIQAIHDKQELHIAPGFNSIALVHQFGANWKKWVGNHLHHRH